MSRCGSATEAKTTNTVGLQLCLGQVPTSLHVLNFSISCSSNQTDCMHSDVEGCVCSKIWCGSVLCCRLGHSPSPPCLQVHNANPFHADQLSCLTGRSCCLQTVQKQAEAQERVGAYAEAAASYRDLMQGNTLVGMHDRAHMQARKAWCLWQSGQAKAVSCCIQFASGCMCWCPSTA